MAERCSRLIPRDWFAVLSNPNIRVSMQIYVHKGTKVSDGMTDFNQSTAKEIYDILSANSEYVPSSITKWRKTYPFEENLEFIGNWRKWFPLKVTREVKLQNFQYRILNKTIPCRAFLSQIKAVPSPDCQECGVRDDVLHFLFECPKAQEFWEFLCEAL